MQFYPQALIVTAVGFALLAYAADHGVGLVFIGVDILLTGGLWLLLPDRWPSGADHTSHQ